MDFLFLAIYFLSIGFKLIMETKFVLVPLAEGFEEIEAVTIIDVLRRAEICVKTTFLKEKMVTGAHNICIEADCPLDEISEEEFDAIILPGGMPGTENLLKSQQLSSILTNFHKDGKWIAAICAAPWVLAEQNLLNNLKATSYPSFSDKLTMAKYCEDNVIYDGKIITSRGPGTAMEFALTIVKLLSSEDLATTLSQQMIVKDAG